MREATASYPFPVLGDERMDYRESCVYKTRDWRIDSGEVHLRHHIDGDSLVARLVKQGDACFGVAVVIKATMYRETFVAGGGELSVSQVVPIKKGVRSIELPKFLPMVIYKGAQKTMSADVSMGLDEFWAGRKFDLHKGAIIAKDRGYEFLPGLSNLLRVKTDPSLDEGAIHVDVVPTSGGYILVRAHPDVRRGIRHAHGDDDKVRHRNSILTHALSEGFTKFAEKYSTEEIWPSLEIFQAAKRQLELKQVAVWGEDNFDPCKAACALLPHHLDSGVPPEEDEND